MWHFNKQVQPLMTGHWCRAMATMMLSGMSAQQVLTTILNQAEKDNRLVAACQKALVEIDKGSSFTEAIRNNHFFNRYQLEQLKIGELSGFLPRTLVNIAFRLEKQRERNQRLKAQLKFAQMIIVITLLANIFIAMLGGLSFLPQIMSLLVVIVITKLIYRSLDLDIFLVLAYAWTYRLIHKVGLLKRFFEYYWYLLLLAQLEAGFDPAQAVANLRELFPSALFRNNSRICQRHLEQGQSLVFALNQGQFILSHQLKQIVIVGERSGRLVPNLKQHLEFEQQQLDIIVASFYEWLPRFYYVLTIGIMMGYTL